jgi:hypothetical protein
MLCNMIDRVWAPINRAPEDVVTHSVVIFLMETFLTKYWHPDRLYAAHVLPSRDPLEYRRGFNMPLQAMAEHFLRRKTY